MKLILTILLFTPSAFAQCKWKENCHCPVPGSTQKWHLAYCSYKTNNEKLESEDVKKCMSSSFAPSGDNCKQNQYWKDEMCKVFHPSDNAREERCKKKFFIPKIVGT
ncbi:MAG: hypothetical protein A4S09_10780 [Proteobacteria bacterium SG_bin7]|nr:MAG: hypothetical protein A4S09_10780 [Proteobacteria bacterium SG_bin7]